MEIGKKMEGALNKQINAELYSAYLYLGMSAYCETLNLKGFAHWLRIQAKEEAGHAMRIYDHVVDRNGCVTLAAIDKPPAGWKNPLEIFEETYRHEKKVTGLINGLYKLAKDEDEWATEVFLQWFINEQVEEEASANEILQRLKMMGDSKIGLLKVDHKLGKRDARDK